MVSASELDLNVTAHAIDPVGNLLFREKKSILVTGTAPFPPPCSFGRGYNSVIIAILLSFLDAYKIIICQKYYGVHTLS